MTETTFYEPVSTPPRPTVTQTLVFTNTAGRHKLVEVIGI